MGPQLGWAPVQRVGQLEPLRLGSPACALMEEGNGAPRGKFLTEIPRHAPDRVARTQPSSLPDGCSSLRFPPAHSASTQGHVRTPQTSKGDRWRGGVCIPQVGLKDCVEVSRCRKGGIREGPGLESPKRYLLSKHFLSTYCVSSSRDTIVI